MFFTVIKTNLIGGMLNMEQGNIRLRNDWNNMQLDTRQRLTAASKLLKNGKIIPPEDMVALLETIIKPGDVVNIEGNNQKQADFLAKCLCCVNPKKVNNLHMVQSVVSLPEHIEVFERGIAQKLDFSYSGPQSGKIAELINEKKVQIGAIHTYLELYGRYFVDLTPKIAMVAALKADKFGNLYTGFSTEDTPVIVEAVKFKQGIVVAQVNEIVDQLPRVDIPGDWVDFVVQSPEPFFIEPLFTRDPELITETKILKAMMAIKGIYMEYAIETVNHGIGFDTAAIELLLPTYGESLGLKGKICTRFVLNPHPTLIPAIESGWVKSVYCFGGEVGMEDYVSARPDVFFDGPDGSMRSNRAFSQVAGHYAVDMFIGSTLQIDKWGNSSTATATRVTGFGGAPNMGCNANGRRHDSTAWMKCGLEDRNNSERIGSSLKRGRKLVVQLVDTLSKKQKPAFVDKLDALQLAEKAGLAIEPVMIYGDEVTHIVTEHGIAYLHKCRDISERMAAIRGIAGQTELGKTADDRETLTLRKLGIIRQPEDLNIDTQYANRSLLAAKNISDLVKWSHGLYCPPSRFLKK